MGFILILIAGTSTTNHHYIWRLPAHRSCFTPNSRFCLYTMAKNNVLLLLFYFIYQGWEQQIAKKEETGRGSRGPPRPLAGQGQSPCGGRGAKPPAQNENTEFQMTWKWFPLIKISFQLKCWRPCVTLKFSKLTLPKKKIGQGFPYHLSFFVRPPPFYSQASIKSWARQKWRRGVGYLHSWTLQQSTHFFMLNRQDSWDR